MNTQYSHSTTCTIRLLPSRALIPLIRFAVLLATTTGVTTALSDEVNTISTPIALDTVTTTLALGRGNGATWVDGEGIDTTVAGMEDDIVVFPADEISLVIVSSTLTV